MKFTRILFFFIVMVCSLCCSHRSEQSLVRIGYFPNITHAQAVIGFSQGRHDFQSGFGSSVSVESKLFNAGPSVIEALFANEIDIAYIGPNPAINGFIKSNGIALRIIAGSMSGGAILVAREGLIIQLPSDWRGKKIASPQLGNTQDIALRYYLQQQGIKTKEYGGETTVLPTQNPDILSLMQLKEIDGAWVPEPWGARLIHEAHASMVLDERTLWPDQKFVTTNIIVRAEFLRQHSDMVKKFLEVHFKLTEWIKNNGEEAKGIINAELQHLTGKALSKEVINEAWSRVEPTCDPLKNTLFMSADRAFVLGFLGKEKPVLDSLYSLDLLNQVLSDNNKSIIQ